MAAHTPPQKLPDGIEVFRAGRHTDDAGQVHEFSEADVADMSSGYSTALREAPLVIGHPKDNGPAYGWVKAVTAAGGVLSIDAHQVEPAFAEMVAAGRFKKRSASFYQPDSPSNPTPGKWYLRHVGFLGAQPPAIAGLKDIQFSGDDAGAVSFSEPLNQPQTQDSIDMSKELQEQLAAKEAELQQAKDDAAAAHAAADKAKAETASFAEKARAERKAGFVAFAEAQVQAGTLLPKDKDMAVATLDALADAQPVSFAEGDTTRTVGHAAWLQDLIANRPPVVSFGEFAAPSAKAATPGMARGKSDADIDKAAQTYARQHSVSYAEALGAVTATFS